MEGGEPDSNRLRRTMFFVTRELVPGALLFSAKPDDPTRPGDAKTRRLHRRVAAKSAAGSCYIAFGAGRIGRVDVDFFSGPSPTGTYYEPSLALRAEKQHFGASRRARWFGL